MTTQTGCPEVRIANANVWAEVDRLRATNAELLAALKDAPNFGGIPTTAFGRRFCEWQKQARTAIAKAEGAQP